MLQLEIQKSDFDKQIWPISVAETLVFKTEFLGEEGLFGVKDNYLNFIQMSDIPERLVISIPESLEETMGFLGSAEYLTHRIMMTPEVTVVGLTEIDDSDLIRKEALYVFAKFIESYNKNVNELDRIKNDW